MRILRSWTILFVLFAWGVIPSLGRPLSSSVLEQQVTRQVQNARPSRPSKSNAPKVSDREQQITQALDNVRLKIDDLKILEHWTTYDGFKQGNTEYVSYEERKLTVWHDFGMETLSIGKEYNIDVETGVSYGEKRPDYVKETRGFPFIFVTDGSGHGTQRIAQEVQQVMKSVRIANPQARILLAMEFAAMHDFVTPIRFAGKPNDKMHIIAPSDQLITQADKLGMDVLALDDTMWWPMDEEYTGTKCGNLLIAIPTPYDDINQDTFNQIDGFLNVSTLGILLRNNQWTSYLKAVKPFYDIVIVYAGQGHIESDTMPFDDVPVKLNEKHVIFNFYTLERNKRQDDFLADTFRMLCDAHACVMEPEEPKEKTILDNQESMAIEWAGPAIEWDGTSFLYARYDARPFMSQIENLCRYDDTLRHRWDYLTVMQEHMTGIKGKEADSVIFSVYLPD